MKIWNNSGIRKALIRIIGYLMILCMFGSIAVSEDVSPEVFYRDGIAVLKYMTVESAQEAVESFSAAGNYQLAPEYRQYALSLIDILSMDEKELNLRSTVNRLQIAEQNEEFRKSLDEKGLPSCESLELYVQARQHEEAGEYIAALNIYKTVRSVLDSMDRQTVLSETAYQQAEELYRNGDYQAAAEIFQNLDYADSAQRYQQVLADHEHQWTEATCTEPKTCAVFGETEGEPLGHDWQEATCTEPKTCRRCGITEGMPLGHDWQAASCTEPGVCTRCGITDSKALGHDWQEATCTEPKTCSRCGATEGEPLEHDWQEATYTAPQTCARCGETAGSPLIQIDSIVQFGHYEQDIDPDNGPEAIEWIVLDYDEANHKALLLSLYGLEAKKYNDEYTGVTWETCTLREWLNNEFLNTAFSAEEQTAILTTEVDNSDGQEFDFTTVYEHAEKTSGGNNTQDKIFLLSYAEANRYLGVTLENSIKARVAPTSYAVSTGAYKRNHYKTENSRAAGYWWLRSPGSNQKCAAYVQDSGSLSVASVDRDERAIRPAFWLDLESFD